MQLSSNFYELHYYVSNFINNNQFLTNFEMSQLAFFIEHAHMENTDASVIYSNRSYKDFHQIVDRNK